MDKRKGHVIWITGLSGVGKTTLGKHLVMKIEKSVQIDGDLVRKKLSPALDYTAKSRTKQIIKIRNLAYDYYIQDKFVIVSALYSNPLLLNENRTFFRNYTEIYLKTDVGELVNRDSKGLYSKFLKGQIKDVVGMDIKWIEPLNPDFIFDNTKFNSCDSMADKIIKRVMGSHTK